MRRLPPLKAWLLFLPAALGLGAAAALQAAGTTNPVYLVRFQADLGSLLAALGIFLSVVLLTAALARISGVRRVRAAEQAADLDASRAQRLFLGRLDHELKNPLTALKMALAFVSDPQSPEAARGKALEDMSAQVERLSRLIGDLRKLAQLEEAGIETHPVPIEEILAEIVEAAQDHPNASGRSLRLTLLKEPWSLPDVPGDRGLLWLAFYNLVENALKFSPPDADIELRAFMANSRLVVETVDSGAGIPEDDLPHIFETLYRGVNARGVPGSGLGLSLVRAVVALHGGSIDVRSRAGQGTVFTVQLPVE